MEVCVDVVPSIVNAVNGGALRLELCSSLAVGGLTPTVGFFQVAQKLASEDCRLYVMIRPRPFDFTYSDAELEVMLRDIKVYHDLGADGFVFGCLNSSGEVHVEHCLKLLAEASPLPCTFHRAFDVVKDPIRSLSIIQNLGFARILTSGQKETAFLGRGLIRKLVDECKLQGYKVTIIPGGGINVGNLPTLLEDTGVWEFHASAKSTAPESGMFLTNEENVREMMRIGKKYNCRYGS